MFDERWLPKKEPTKAAVPALAGVADVERWDRARKWLARREPAVSGQYGHGKMFKTAVALFRMFRLSPEEVWALLCEYNARCVPPFSESELRHKWADAQKPYP